MPSHSLWQKHQYRIQTNHLLQTYGERVSFLKVLNWHAGWRYCAKYTSIILCILTLRNEDGKKQQRQKRNKTDRTSASFISIVLRCPRFFVSHELAQARVLRQVNQRTALSTILTQIEKNSR